jgi:hypothetical protein
MSVNETRVYQHHYRFETDGAAYIGTSYQIGGGIKDNQSVTIEFPQGEPNISRIQGMRRKAAGLFGLFPIIFPAVGLCFIIGSLRRGVKGMRLASSFPRNAPTQKSTTEPSTS